MAATFAKISVAWRQFRDGLRFGWPLAWGSNRRLCVCLLAASAASAIAGPMLVLVLGASVSEIQQSLDAATIRPGECVGLVGPNGAGKTTLAKLMTRLYEPSDGAVLIDGIDLREWNVADLHRQISAVFQEPARFEATVADNIAFGDWERLLNEPTVIQDVARRTGFHDCIVQLPEGYGTHVGRQFGRVDLSGGQWRQLAVTRAMANDPALVVLDEPTANLDAHAEERFFRSIRQMLAGRTSILISHRFSTLRLADRLLVLDAGRLVEHGSHEDLVRKDGLYASMYRAFSARLPGGEPTLSDAA